MDAELLAAKFGVGGKAESWSLGSRIEARRWRRQPGRWVWRGCGDAKNSRVHSDPLELGPLMTPAQLCSTTTLSSQPSQVTVLGFEQDEIFRLRSSTSPVFCLRLLTLLYSTATFFPYPHQPNDALVPPNQPIPPIPLFLPVLTMESENGKQVGLLGSML